MSEEKIDIESLFDLHDDLPAPKQPPKKRPFPKGVLVMLLAVVILAGGILAYDHISNLLIDEQNLIQYTTLLQRPIKLEDVTPGNYGIRVQDGQNIWTLKDVPAFEARTYNFWLRIDATARAVDEDWTFVALTNRICNASAHSNQNTHWVAVSKMYREDDTFAGWMIYGYLPRSAELDLQLHDKDRRLKTSKLLVVNPLMDNCDEMDTATLLDYAVHLEGMLDLLALSNTEMIYGSYMNLTGKHPALKELIGRGDLPKAVSQYLSSDATTCKTLSTLVSAVYFRHLNEAKDYGTYMSTAEAMHMNTKDLVYYLIYHNGFQNYMNAIGTADKVDLQKQYAYAKEFCRVLSVLENRNDAAQEMIPLCDKEIVPRFLLSQPQFRSQMTLQDAEDYLLTCYSSPTLFSVQTSVLAEVIVSLGEVYDLAVVSALEDAVEGSAVLTALTQRSDAVRYLLIQLQSAQATRGQTINATALLELPVFNQQLTGEERAIFEQHKTYPDTVPNYDPPTAQLVEEMLNNSSLIASPILSSALDPEAWYWSILQNYPILQQLEERWDAVQVMNAKLQALTYAENSLLDKHFLSALLRLSVYHARMTYITP